MRRAIPRQADLIAQIHRANRFAAPWVAFQLAACATLASFIEWAHVVESPLFYAIAVAVIVGPSFMSILRYYAQAKKEIGDLKEQTRFGELDKYRLKDLYLDTLDRLGLSPPGPPVYITPDKSLNASSLHLGLGGFFRSLNGVYLNRQVLHRLTPAEVQDIIGHELGHFYKYYLINLRFRGLTMILGALAGILVTQWIGMSTFFSMIALTFCGYVSSFVPGMLNAMNGEAIEYLCDGFGAQVHGVVVSINGLLKVGASSELQLAIQQQELLNRRHPNLNARDVIEAIEAAIPYGNTTPAELERAVEESLKRRSKERRTLSFAGFAEYAWNADDEDELEDEMKKIRSLQSMPRLNWESLLDRPGQIALTEEQIGELVAWIENSPNEVLFRLPSEMGDPDDVHPPLWARICYLWRNRDEIAAARREP